MTDGELARVTVEANRIEQLARTHLGASGSDQGEQDSARAAVRQAVALRRALESGIVTRATRAPR